MIYGFERLQGPLQGLPHHPPGDRTAASSTSPRSGTGNYNEKTAELSTPTCLLMTASPRPSARRPSEYFKNMAIGNLDGSMISTCWWPPCRLKSRQVLELIDEQIRTGAAPAGSSLKMNSLTDVETSSRRRQRGLQSRRPH